MVTTRLLLPRLALVVTVGLAACSSSPSPGPTASPAAVLSATPVGSPLGAVGSPTTDHVGTLTVVHPAGWTLTRGPGGDFSPLFYLSNTTVVVPPCPTPDQSGLFNGCPLPLSVLPSDGILVTVAPNMGLAEIVPPVVNVQPASDGCLGLGGTIEMESVAGGTVVTACIRGPDSEPLEDGVRTVIDSLFHSRT